MKRLSNLQRFHLFYKMRKKVLFLLQLDTRPMNEFNLDMILNIPANFKEITFIWTLKPLVDCNYKRQLNPN